MASGTKLIFEGLPASKTQKHVGSQQRPHDFGLCLNRSHHGAVLALCDFRLSPDDKCSLPILAGRTVVSQAAFFDMIAM